MITHAAHPLEDGARCGSARRDILRGCLGAGCSLWDPSSISVSRKAVSVIVHPPGSVGTSNSGPSFCPAGDEHDWRARCIGVLGRSERDAARWGPACAHELMFSLVRALCAHLLLKSRVNCSPERSR